MGDLDRLIAEESLELVPALSVKRTIVLSAAERRLEQSKVKTLAGILHRLQKMATDRNDIIHGTWLVSPEHPKHLVWGKPGASARLRVYGEDELKTVVSDIEDIDTELVRFYWFDVLGIKLPDEILKAQVRFAKSKAAKSKNVKKRV